MIKTIDLTNLEFFEASKTFNVPLEFTSKVVNGFLYDSKTRGCPAKWKIIDGFEFLINL